MARLAHVEVFASDEIAIVHVLNRDTGVARVEVFASDEIAIVHGPGLMWCRLGMIPRWLGVG